MENSNHSEFQSAARDRRANTDLVLAMVQKMLDSHNDLGIKIAKMETTLDTQVKTIEKYNNYGMRIITLEGQCTSIHTALEDIKTNCSAVQKAKTEAKIRATPPWPVIITGTILIFVSVFVNLAVNRWL